MIMIDPKMVELIEYSRVPHLMHPIVKDMKKAEAILAWAVDKMEERYDLDDHDRPEDGRADRVQPRAAPDAPHRQGHEEGRGHPRLGGGQDGGALRPAQPGPRPQHRQ